jgi:hypothetical protein
MRRRDLLIIPAAAIGVMIVNVAVSFGVVWVYATFVEPGRADSYYEAYAMRTAPISSVIAGIPIMLLAGFLLAGRRSRRAAFQAAGAAALVYIAIDLAILVAARAPEAVWPWAAASHSTKLLSALAGAALRIRGTTSHG